jgi:hypothetical protein
MAFGGTESIRSKIFINDRILEQIRALNYLGYNMSCKGETDFNIKVGHFIRFADHD